VRLVQCMVWHASARTTHTHTHTHTHTYTQTHVLYISASLYLGVGGRAGSEKPLTALKGGG
jgi:hypothetical protein